ncbi:MAG TPA: hypothetical protein V6C81_19040 [Planktothrix sp.]
MIAVASASCGFAILGGLLFQIYSPSGPVITARTFLNLTNTSKVKKVIDFYADW